MLSLILASVLAQDSWSQQFGPAQQVLSQVDHPLSIFAVDLDGDGDRDVLSASFDDDKVAWFENVDGSGAFGPQHVITTKADGARFVLATDIDGDGDPDVLSASALDD